MRESVYHHAMAMEKELRENDHKGGWGDCSVEWLLIRLEQEYREFLDAVKEGEPGKVRSEGADISNFTMMITERVQTLAFEKARRRY